MLVGLNIISPVMGSIRIPAGEAAFIFGAPKYGIKYELE